MKLASLLLTAVAALVIQGSAHAQTLSGAASSLRSSLNDLFVAVDKTVPREAGRDRIKDSIQRTRGQLARVQTLAEEGAPRDVIRDSKERSREGTLIALDAVRNIRSEYVRNFARDVSERLGWFDSGWENYGRRSAPSYGRDDRRGGTVYVPVPVPVRRH